MFRVAKVQTIHDSKRTSADARKIQQRFSDGECCALSGIDRTPAMVAIGGERNATTSVGSGGRVLQTKHRSIATGTFNGVEEQLMVVLREHPARIGEKFE